MPNLPGFGGAPPLPRDETSMERYAQHVYDVIQKEAGGRAIVGGFSMGGYVLFSLLRSHPETVAAAMFMDTRPEPDSADARAGRLKGVETIENEGLEAFFDVQLPNILAKKPRAEARAQAHALMRKQNPEGVKNALVAMSKRRDSTDLLAELTLPVLVVVGAEDRVTPPSVALNMQSHMPQAMVVQIVSAGHLTPLEQPTSVNAAIDSFLSTVKS
jgi:pimeloyl-ACP methyl ester carboxylesterase